MRHSSSRYILLLIQSLFLTIKAISITLIDNFSNTILNPSGNPLDHPVSNFIDSANKNIKVGRIFPESLENSDQFHSKFTLTSNNLNYNSSKPTLGNFDVSNTIFYLFNEPANLTNMPILKFNCTNISQNTTAKLQLPNGSINIPFNQTNPIIQVNLFDINHLSPSQADLSQIAFMTITLNTENIADVTADITSIELIPEPLSIVTLTGGIVHFFKKRNKKK